MFETVSNGKGEPYNAKLCSCIYCLRSRHIGVKHIAPIIKNVLSLVGVEVDQLTCKSTSLNLDFELGYIARKQKQFNNAERVLLHKNGHHYLFLYLMAQKHIQLV